MDQFESLLKELKMSKSKFAEVSGLTRESIYRWKAPPKWAIALLTLMAELQRLSLKYR